MERQLAKQELAPEPPYIDRIDVDQGAPDALLTRQAFQRRLERSLPAASSDSVPRAALLFVGLDQFKQINRVFGQHAGDMVLEQVAERLRNLFGATAVLGRLGGDEFAICLGNAGGKDDIAQTCVRIGDAIGETLLVMERQVNLRCCVGVAIFPSDAQDAQGLFQCASLALEQAKKVGPGHCQFISTELIHQIEQRRRIAEVLRTAIAGEALHLLYQPVIDLQTGKICGVEALVRWMEQGAQGISTPYLIEVAEESGLIADLGDWVVRRACADLQRRDELGLPRFPVALNISSVELQNPLYAENLARALAEMGSAPNMVSIEVTESVMVQGGAIAVANLEKLKSLGIDLTLDDFGTGSSSLSHLKSLPFTRVKIDRSFIKHVPDNGEDTAISKAIISMAHSLGIRVVAEGVETEAQCGFLSQNMCDEMQGYFFSNALDAAALEELLRQGPVLPEKLLRLQKPRRTLLLVDDEGNIVSALKRLLRTHDFRILTANSGQGGLEVLTKNPVDVIISDQRMPGMTGVEFLGKAKELYPDTVRIVLSGYTELHSVTDAVNQGAIYKFLTKPWDDDQLLEHIHEAFRHKGMADENRRLNLEVLTANQELAQANRRLEDLLQQKQQQIIRDEVSLDIVREALQQIPLAVIGVDDSDTIVFANDEAQALFEDAPSILGSDVNQLIPDLAHATGLGSQGAQCTIEIGRRFFEVVSRRMGRGSQSRGRLMTISPFKALA